MEAFQAGMLLSTMIEAMAVNAYIEGMKAANSQFPEDQPYTEKDFKEKADHLWALSNQAQSQVG